MKSMIKNILIITICFVIGFIISRIILNIFKIRDANILEIEKKWLISKEDIPYDLEKADKYEIVQTYLNFNPEMRVRNINDGEMYIFAMKRDTEELGLTREEYEINITKEEYESLLKKQEGETIYKTRYQLPDENGLIMAFDIFSGDFDGLAYMEIEFESEAAAAAYGNPEWVKKDITRDLNYKNGHLARYGIPETYEEYIK